MRPSSSRPQRRERRAPQLASRPSTAFIRPPDRRVPAAFSAGRDIDVTLFRAALSGDVKTMGACIRRGAEPSWRNPRFQRYTPVHAAVIGGGARFGDANRAARTLQILIEAGAQVNAQDNAAQWTPLMLACASGHRFPALLLLFHGAEHRLTDATGSVTALTLARGSPMPSVADEIAHFARHPRKLEDEIAALRSRADASTAQKQCGWNARVRDRPQDVPRPIAPPARPRWNPAAAQPPPKAQPRPAQRPHTAVQVRTSPSRPAATAAATAGSNMALLRQFLATIGLDRIAPLLRREGVEKRDDLLVLTTADMNDLSRLARLNRVQRRHLDLAIERLRQGFNRAPSQRQPPPRRRPRTSSSMQPSRCNPLLSPPLLSELLQSVEGIMEPSEPSPSLSASPTGSEGESGEEALPTIPPWRQGREETQGGAHAHAASAAAAGPNAGAGGATTQLPQLRRQLASGQPRPPGPRPPPGRPPAHARPRGPPPRAGPPRRSGPPPRDLDRHRPRSVQFNMPHDHVVPREPQHRVMYPPPQQQADAFGSFASSGADSDEDGATPNSTRPVRPFSRQAPLAEPQESLRTLEAPPRRRHPLAPKSSPPPRRQPPPRPRSSKEDERSRSSLRCSPEGTCR